MSTVLEVSGPTSDLDPYSDEFLTDPFPALDLLRDAGPAVHLTRYGVWGVAGHTDAWSVLRDHERFSSASGVGLANLRTEAYGWRKPSVILEVDPPLHTAHRALVGSTTSPRAIRTFQEVFATEAARLADELVARGTFDAVPDLAEVFPTVVFPHALGADGDAREALLAYGSLSFNAIGPRNRHLDAALERAGGVLDWIAESCLRTSLRPGSIGAAIYEAADAGGIAEETTASLIRSLFSAGVDTTASALAFAVRAFAQHPDQWQLIRDDPGLARNAFEEVVRLESPAIGFYRTTTTEVTLGEARIPAQSKVLVFFAGANHDPRQWARPREFDVLRKTGGHLGFGAGPHLCAGMTIARMEADAILRALAERVRSWHLDGEPVPRLNNSLRSLSSLPVRVTAA